MKKIFSILIFCLIVAESFAQSTPPIRNCGAMEMLEKEVKEDPGRLQRMKAIERFTKNYINSPTSNKQNVVHTIPTVIHIVYKSSAENISTAQINSQMQILNDDFRRLNADADNVWSQAADAEIEFCLATVDPNGNPTTGITRTATNVAFTPSQDMKFNASGGINAWPTDKYMNVWVCSMGGGILGFAQFPGGDPNTDGIVCDYRFFGNIGAATAPYDLGRTMTHEVGHYLNLRHIWGDGDCGYDDFVSDTPWSDAPNYNCALNHVSCSSVDMIQNYMDYTNDVCMNLFTQGQKTRMKALFAPGGARISLLNNNLCAVGCPTDLTVNNTVTDQQYYKAGNSITGTGTITNSADVNFRAGDKVQMTPGFNAMPGTKFRAHIGDCEDPE